MANSHVFGCGQNMTSGVWIPIEPETGGQLNYVSEERAKKPTLPSPALSARCLDDKFRREQGRSDALSCRR